MNHAKRRLLSAAALLLALIFTAGCAGTSGCLGCLGCSREVEPAATPVPTGEAFVTDAPVFTDGPVVTEEPYYVSMPTFDGFVRAAKTGSYGVASDGSVRFMGMSTRGQNLIYDWANVVDLEVNDTSCAALMRDSSIRLAGACRNEFADALLWTGIVDIAMGYDHMVGLRTDGTLVCCGSNAEAYAGADTWTGVLKVAAAGNFTAALTGEGVLTTLGEEADLIANSAPVADISASADRLVLLFRDGTVKSIVVGLPEEAVFELPTGLGTEPTEEPRRGGTTGRDSNGRDNGGKDNSGKDNSGKDNSGKDNSGKEDPGKENRPNPFKSSEEEWSGIEKVFAGIGATYAIDGTGKLYSSSDFVDEQITDAYFVAASAEHAVVLHSDGTCSGFGANDCLQGNVRGWRLLPYVTEEGWLLGFGTGKYIDGELVGTGKQTTYTDPATGQTRDVTIVILGDVNGDGAIDEQDIAAVNAHIDGTAKLEGAYLRAANIIKDGSKPDSIDVVDLERLTSHVRGGMQIDQYAKTDKYTAPLADAKRRNPDALGYITLEGTNISYPIMYDLNWYYNDHDIDRNEVVRGSIYFYWSKANRNIVITGHNSRTSGTMFHELHKIQDNKKQLMKYENRLWAINTYGRTDYWEVWALYEEPAFKNASDSSQMYNTCWPNTFNAMNDRERQAWINYQLRKNELKYTTVVSTEDRFMTLVTCGDHHADSSKGARLYIFLRWVGND